MFRLPRGASAAVARSPLSFDVGRAGFGVAGVLSLGGAVLALAVLVGLSLTGAPAQAAFPGTNGKIVCAGAITPRTEADEDFEIYSMNPDGSGQTFLTNNGPLLDPADPNSFVDEFDPAVSPDAQTVAFESTRTGASELYTMNADGTGDATRLTTARGEDRPGSYSPDGSKIVFHSTRDADPGSADPGIRNNFEVYVMNADGSNQTRLTSRPGQDSNPSWSPDGTRIAFHATRAPGEPGNTDPPGTPSNLEIYTMNPDGGDVRRVTNFSGIDAFPQWSPDGGKLVFRRDLPATPPATGANSEIFTINADGSGPATNLSNNAIDDPVTTSFPPESFDDQGIWSPDGTRIVFDSFRSGDREVYTMSAADGSGVTRLTNAAGFDGRCDWARVRPAGERPPVTPPVNPPPARVCPAASAASAIRGTAAGNRITGTAGADRILAAGGNDVVDALAGDDCVDLGTGNDRGEGGSGGDRMAGGRGRDRMSGSAGNDRLRGGQGSDRLLGGRGNDRAFGDSGADVVLASFGNDVLHGVAGNDRLSGGRGRDRINGGSGNDRVAGGSSPDRVRGDRGNDRIDGNSGRDRIAGNSGNDRIGARDGARDRVDCGPGRDRVVADRADRVARNCERVRRR